MPGRKDSVQAFLKRYVLELPQLREAAQQAEALTRHLLRNLGSAVHLVSCRAKDHDSVLGKLLRKNYRYPSKQMTDLIGVRIITYYQSDIDRVVAILRDEFEVEPRMSVDKRRTLDLRAFGYRSVHLICRLKGHRAASPEYAPLAGRWFEIQIRSVLEHAWAEVEHEVAYKSGIAFPGDFLRRFAALAGTLELVDKEFLALRAVRSDLIDQYRQRYASELDQDVEIDTARLLALLESEWPRNPSWRDVEEANKPFPAYIEERCVAALSHVGARSARSLRRTFRSRRFRRALREFANLELIPPSRVSHLALTMLVLAIRDLDAFQRFFPDFATSAAVSAVKEKRRLRGRGRI